MTILLFLCVYHNNIYYFADINTCQFSVFLLYNILYRSTSSISVVFVELFFITNVVVDVLVCTWLLMLQFHCEVRGPGQV